MRGWKKMKALMLLMAVILTLSQPAFAMTVSTTDLEVLPTESPSQQVEEPEAEPSELSEEPDAEETEPTEVIRINLGSTWAESRFELVLGDGELSDVLTADENGILEIEKSRGVDFTLNYVEPPTQAEEPESDEEHDPADSEESSSSAEASSTVEEAKKPQPRNWLSKKKLFLVIVVVLVGIAAGAIVLLSRGQKQYEDYDEDEEDESGRYRYE